MTNTQEAVDAQISDADNVQEEIQLTELLPVRQSRINDRDKDQHTTDGLKVLRSFTEDDNQFNTLNSMRKRQISVSCKQVDYVDGEENDGKANNRKTRKVTNKDFPKDEVYYFYQEKQIESVSDEVTNPIEQIPVEGLKQGVQNGQKYSKTRKSGYEVPEDSSSKSTKRMASGEDEVINSAEQISMQKFKPKNGQKPYKTKSTAQKLSKNLSPNIAPHRESGSDEVQKSGEERAMEKTKPLLLKNSRKSWKTQKTAENVCEDSSSKVEEEKGLRMNMKVILQASNILQHDNDNSSEDNQNQSDALTIQSIQTDQVEPSSLKDSESLKKYSCVICDAKFKGNTGLSTHYKVVHGTGPSYKCDDCGKEFPLKERLKLHVRIHTGIKPYKCTDCGKDFARGGQLKQHRTVHSKEKPYQCKLCFGTFTCSGNLALHMKRHKGQKDHTCSICGKGFIRRDALKKHLECLHKDLKTFRCTICHKTFKGHLPQHMRTHAHDKPHACATCGQKFAQKSQLTVHQRTHTGQRPFRCLVCWQAFAHSTALKLHTRRHTGERPFKCPDCNVGFTQLPHWKKHMKCIHKKAKPYSCRNCDNCFQRKHDLENHVIFCHGADDLEGTDNNDADKGTDSAAYKNMSLERMRLLLAALLKRISTPERLDELGFGKRLIDEILQDSLISAGKEPIKHGRFSELVTLQKNLKTFLEWTVPKEHWDTFMKMNKSPEEILETLTTS